MNSKELIDKHSIEQDGFIYPNWDSIGEVVDGEFAEADYDGIYHQLACEWLRKIKLSLGGEFTVLESSNFLILCDEKPHIEKNLAYHCERSLKLILDEFGGELADEGYGKHVLIVFKTTEEYYAYTRFFSSGNSEPMTGGMCIYSGYTHIALPYIANDMSPVGEIAHELTHALMFQYELPNWLDEAVAMRMEDIALEQDGLYLDEKRVQAHREHWNEKTIQEFWSGEVWYKAADAFGLSYELARILWIKIAVDIDATKAEIIEFIKTVNRDDSGNAAFKAIFNYSLGDLVEDFLGEGNWAPDEEYILSKKNVLESIPEWIQEVAELKKQEENELLLRSVREMKPSLALGEYLQKLGVETIGDLVNVSADRVYEYREVAREQNNEIYVKLNELGIYMKHEEDLFNVCEVFSVLSDGKLVGGYTERNGCVLHLEIPYLAEMIAPNFKQFKIEILGFGGYVYEPLKVTGEGNGQEKLRVGGECLSLEELVRSDMELVNAQVDLGRVIIGCMNKQDEDNPTGGHFFFYGEGARVFDEEGREWTVDKLGELADDYWQGA